jgi:hypothetical protein
MSIITYHTHLDEMIEVYRPVDDCAQMQAMPTHANLVVSAKPCRAAPPAATRACAWPLPKSRLHVAHKPRLGEAVDDAKDYLDNWMLTTRAGPPERSPAFVLARSRYRVSHLCLDVSGQPSNRGVLNIVIASRRSPYPARRAGLRLAFR